MGLSYQDAYTAIKALEADGGPLPLPEPTTTITVGSIDAQTGAFTWAVPTFSQTYDVPVLQRDTVRVAPVGPGISVGEAGDGIPIQGLPTNPGGPIGPIQPATITVGIVTTNVVNLTLEFDVTNAPSASETLRADAVVTPGIAASIGKIGPIIGANIGTTGDVAISGFPNLPSQGSRMYLNAGIAASAMETTQNVTPPISVFPIQITVHGQIQFIHLAIIRPPVLGLGGFTIPALPVAIIYAPPQGAEEE